MGTGVGVSQAQPAMHALTPIVEAELSVPQLMGDYIQEQIRMGQSFPLRAQRFT